MKNEFNCIQVQFKRRDSIFCLKVVNGDTDFFHLEKKLEIRVTVTQTPRSRFV